jgi:hypothetical protein
VAEQRSSLAQGFSWDPVGARYRDTATGRYVPAGQVRAALDAVVDGSAERMRAIAGRLQSGEISLKEWQLGMAREIKAVHVAATASSAGGFAQLSQADLGWVGQRVRTQYQYLDRYAREIASGKQPMDGTLLSRAALYGHAGRATGREAERRESRLRGDDEARRVLGVADHCRTCLSEARRGWQPIGDLRAIGDTECGPNDACHFETRRAA